MALFFAVGDRRYFSRDCIDNGAFGYFSVASKYLAKDDSGGRGDFTYGDVAVMVRVHERVVVRGWSATQGTRLWQPARQYPHLSSWT